MDIFDELSISPSRGRKPQRIAAEYVRDLDEADIVLMNSDVSLGSITPAVKKLRHSHHQVAQLLAAGLQQTEVAVITGYSQSRISILQNDPAFSNLVSYYADAAKEINIDVLVRLKDLGTDAIQEIRDRLDESSESMSLRELLEIAELALDRSGFGPKSTVKHEIGLDDQMKEMIKESVDKEAMRNVKTIEGELAPAPVDRGPAVGDTPAGETGVPSGTAEIHQLPSKRTDV